MAKVKKHRLAKQTTVANNGNLENPKVSISKSKSLAPTRESEPHSGSVSVTKLVNHGPPNDKRRQWWSGGSDQPVIKAIAKGSTRGDHAGRLRSGYNHAMAKVKKHRLAKQTTVANNGNLDNPKASQGWAIVMACNKHFSNETGSDQPVIKAIAKGSTRGDHAGRLRSGYNHAMAKVKKHRLAKQTTVANNGNLENPKVSIGKSKSLAPTRESEPHSRSVSVTKLVNHGPPNDKRRQWWSGGYDQPVIKAIAKGSAASRRGDDGGGGGGCGGTERFRVEGEKYRVRKGRILEPVHWASNVAVRRCHAAMGCRV
ncbi:hypothetical protein Dimus_009421 [Dionaea muscipula]